MAEVIINKNDEIVMKLLHYFITEQNYNPVVLRGVKDEIWLENQNAPYKIIRIVTNYIHNDEQFNYDILKTRHIIKKIKHKTFNINLKTLSIFLNIGDNVHSFDRETEQKDLACINIKEIEDIKKYNFVIEDYPDILENSEFKEKGMELFIKLTNSINAKSEKEAIKAEEVFKQKKIIITYILIAINVLIYLLTVFKNQNYFIYMFGNMPDLIRKGEYYRLITSMFMHGGVMHLICNCYTLYIVGSQIENFFGKFKYLLIYFISGIIGGLLSMLFNSGVSIGASGAIFGLLGALLYFGYHYRVYLGEVMRSQIIPLIILNLGLGFMLTGIDNAAYIGGLVGGIVLSVALGIKHKSDKYEKVHGAIFCLILIGFLVYMNFFK